MMKITANGKCYHIEVNTTLPDFIKSIGLRISNVVVEKNLQALTPGEARATILADGDSLEIVHIVAGG